MQLPLASVVRRYYRLGWPAPATIRAVFEQFTGDPGRNRNQVGLIAGGAVAGAWVSVMVLVLSLFAVTEGASVLLIPVVVSYYGLPVAAIGAIIGAVLGSRLDIS